MKSIVYVCVLSFSATLLLPQQVWAQSVEAWVYSEIAHEYRLPGTQSDATTRGAPPARVSTPRVEEDSAEEALPLVERIKDYQDKRSV